MSMAQNIFCSTAGWLRLVLLAGLVALSLPTRAANLQLPTLHTKQGTFTNVVVTAKTESDIYIRHERGIANVKLKDIEDDDALIALGLKERPVKVEEVKTVEEEPTTATTNAPPQVETAADRYKELALAKLKELKNLQPPIKILTVILVAIFVLYLFKCYCLKLICVKAGHQPGVLVWLPFLQLIPAFRASGMSAWWILALFVPLLNLVAAIMWCFKITSARGKSIWVAIMLLLPGLNLLAFLYLAFSSANE